MKRTYFLLPLSILLLCGLGISEQRNSAASTPAAAVAKPTTEAPKLTDAQKLELRETQLQITALQGQAAELKLQYTDNQNNLAQAKKHMSELLIADAEKLKLDLKAWKIDERTLNVEHVQEAEKKPQ